MSTILSIYPPVLEIPQNFRLVNWEVKQGEAVLENCTLAKLEGVLDQKIYAITSPNEGVVTSMKLKNLTQQVSSETPIAIFQVCDHPVTFGGLCTNCGADVSQIRKSANPKSGVFLSNPHIQVTMNHARKLEEENVNRLKGQKKLALVLDLDNTILHACTEDIIRVSDPLAKKKFIINSGQFTYGFHLPPSRLQYFVKVHLRSFVNLPF